MTEEQKAPLKFIPVSPQLFKEVDALARGWHCENHSDAIWKLLGQLKQAEAQRDKLAGVAKQLNDLINESHGVIGLHLNGDEASWDWLIENGWLDTVTEIENLTS